MTPTGVVAEPQQIAILIGHIPRYADLVAVEVVGLLAAFAFEGIAFYGNAAVVVAFAVTALSVGVDAVDEFAVFIETVYFRSSQCVGNDGMVFAVGETAQFFAVTSVNGGQIAVAVVVVAIW